MKRKPSTKMQRVEAEGMGQRGVGRGEEEEVFSKIGVCTSGVRGTPLFRIVSVSLSVH